MLEPNVKQKLFNFQYIIFDHSLIHFPLQYMQEVTSLTELSSYKCLGLDKSIFYFFMSSAMPLSQNVVLFEIIVVSMNHGSDINSSVILSVIVINKLSFISLILGLLSQRQRKLKVLLYLGHYL